MPTERQAVTHSYCSGFIVGWSQDFPRKKRSLRQVMAVMHYGFGCFVRPHELISTMRRNCRYWRSSVPRLKKLDGVASGVKLCTPSCATSMVETLANDGLATYLGCTERATCFKYRECSSDRNTKQTWCAGKMSLSIGDFVRNRFHGTMNASSW